MGNYQTDSRIQRRSRLGLTVAWTVTTTSCTLPPPRSSALSSTAVTTKEVVVGQGVELKNSLIFLIFANFLIFFYDSTGTFLVNPSRPIRNTRILAPTIAPNNTVLPVAVHDSRSACMVGWLVEVNWTGFTTHISLRTLQPYPPQHRLPSHLPTVSVPILPLSQPIQALSRTTSPHLPRPAAILPA
jgi:hypothetical protein